MINNSSILITWTINNIGLWILTSIVYIVDIFLESICYLGLMLLSIGIMVWLRLINWIRISWSWLGLVGWSVLVGYVLAWSALSCVLLVYSFLCLNLWVVWVVSHWLSLVANVTALYPWVVIARSIATSSSWSISTFIFFILIMNTLRIYICWSFFHFTCCQLFQICNARFQPFNTVLTPCKSVIWWRVLMDIIWVYVSWGTSSWISWTSFTHSLWRNLI